jgi:hypothetical protein
MSDEIKKLKESRAVQENLRQFLKLETGLGNSPQFQRGWVFNFQFTDAQRAEVNSLMEAGVPFDEAFDRVRGKAS